MAKEKIRTLNSRSFFLLTCIRRNVIRGCKENEQSLIITVENKGGVICFTLKDLATDKCEILENPETGVYELPLKKGGKYQFTITANFAKGKYKIQKKTIIE